MLQDTKHALRRLIQQWPFTLGAVTILSVGIGANATIFSLVNMALFRPQPFADSERLVNIYQNDPAQGQPAGSSYPALLDMRREQGVFQGVAATYLMEGRYRTVSSGSAIRFGLFEYSTANLLDVLGLRPSMGRWFTEEEERAGEGVAVVSRTTWTRRFQGDPQIIGQTIQLKGQLVKVIGVGPVELDSTAGVGAIVDFWMPFTAQPGAALATWESRRDLRLQVRARLRQGVSVSQAQASMDVLGKRLAAEYRDEDPGKGITVLATNDVRYSPFVDRQLRPMAAGVLAIVGLVLAIACSNLATLLLVRGASRAAEFSVRLALGATRWQLARHLLIESMALAAAGAIVGCGLAAWGLRYFSTLDLPFAIGFDLDYRMLGFAVSIAFVCGIGFGIAPALRSTRTDLTGALKDQKSQAGVSLARGWFSLKNALIVGQVTASFILMMATAFGVRILAATQPSDEGYRTTDIAMIETEPTYAGYDLARARSAFDELNRRVSAIPGVVSSFTSSALPADAEYDTEVWIDGYRGDSANADAGVSIEGRFASPGYFETMGIPILFGRGFEVRDQADTPEVAVVSETFARTFFGSPNAVGRRFRYGADRKWIEIAGVAGDTRELDELAQVPQPFLYRADRQAGAMPTSIVAHTRGDAAAVVEAMRREVTAFDAGLPITRALTMEQLLISDLRPWQIAIAGLGSLSGIGLTLAGLGLYAVVAFAVTQRSQEMGIRMALGAQAWSLVWLVVRDVTLLIGVGVGIGAAIAGAGLVASGAVSASVPGADPLTFIAVALAMAMCGALAAFVPARRAARTDPLVSIRHQ